jgi:hypothetical protein
MKQPLQYATKSVLPLIMAALALGSNRPLGLKVATYLEDAKDAVTLDVRMGQLNDGTTFPSDATLDGKAKKLKVTVNNGGYRTTKSS